VVDSALADYPDDYFNDNWWVLITSGTCDGQERRVSDFVSSTGTVTVSRAFTAQIASAVTYKLLRFRPSKITEKANDAIKRTKYLFQTIRDDNTATRENVRRYSVPTTIIRDPLQIWISNTSLNTKTINACTAAWSESVDSDVTLLVDDLDYQENSASLKFTVAAGASAGDILATAAISSLDLSNDTGVMFAIKSSVATAAGDLQILLDEHASCASPSETLNVPALAAGKWEIVMVSYAGATTARDAIISVGLKYTVDLGACTINLSEIKSITTLPADTLTDQQGWSRLEYWLYEADGHKVYIPYYIPANRILRMVGKGFLTALSTQSGTTEADEPEISHLYSLTLAGLYQEQYASAVGKNKDEAQKNFQFHLSEAERKGKELRLDIPGRTVKNATFTYGGY
jgi:hypothetical protein